MQYRVPQPLVRSSVVRIYRSDSEHMAGVVEDVESGRSVAFSSMEELWDALRTSSGTPKQSVGATPPAR